MVIFQLLMALITLFIFPISDDEDPVLTCPPDILIGTDPGLITGNATWDPANVTDNSMQSYTPVADAESGTPFPIGVTTVQFNATDDSGNTGSCTFTVTVEGTVILVLLLKIWPGIGVKIIVIANFIAGLVSPVCSDA